MSMNHILCITQLCIFYFAGAGDWWENHGQLWIWLTVLCTCIVLTGWDCYCVSVTFWNCYNSSTALPLTCVQWTVTDQHILGHRIKFNQWLLLLYVPLFDFCLVHSWRWGSLQCCLYCLPCEEQPQRVWVTGMATLWFQQRTQRRVAEYTVGWHQLAWLATPLTPQFQEILGRTVHLQIIFRTFAEEKRLGHVPLSQGSVVIQLHQGPWIFQTSSQWKVLRGMAWCSQHACLPFLFQAKTWNLTPKVHMMWTLIIAKMEKITTHFLWGRMQPTWYFQF